ncbi:hypothetical protein GJ496_002108 [Pomphorhynchus laevis]|nr:hypothetical protein GJ496_002108 [Pomphorhynchus laevis]
MLIYSLQTNNQLKDNHAIAPYFLFQSMYDAITSFDKLGRMRLKDLSKSANSIGRISVGFALTNWADGISLIASKAASRARLVRSLAEYPLVALFTNRQIKILN